LSSLKHSDLDLQLKHEIFGRRQGVFVTLEIDGRLRGCMGSLAPHGTVREEVATNALNAAFNDPRFPGLTVAEFDRVDLSVSILTNPEPLSFKTPEELVKKLVPAKDGVIIQKGRARATFLPQVWDQLPGKTDFLAHLCTKAGLASDDWTRPGLDVRTYRVQHFS
jgi:AmmeMemoRadiSam system protein A